MAVEYTGLSPNQKYLVTDETNANANYIEVLKKIGQKVWKNIMPEYLYNQYKSMPQRMPLLMQREAIPNVYLTCLTLY